MCRINGLIRGDDLEVCYCRAFDQRGISTLCPPTRRPSEIIQPPSYRFQRHTEPMNRRETTSNYPKVTTTSQGNDATPRKLGYFNRDATPFLIPVSRFPWENFHVDRHVLVRWRTTATRFSVINIEKASGFRLPRSNNSLFPNSFHRELSCFLWGIVFSLPLRHSLLAPAGKNIADSAQP